MKTILYRVITFVDSEKNGPKISLYNANDRLHIMLGLSRHSISNLRREMRELTQQQNSFEQEEEEANIRPQRQTTSNTHIKRTPSQQYASKQYPTTEKLLTHLLEETPDFPVQSDRTLLRHMRRLGFKYAATSKAPVRLDARSFIASRAKYFRSLSDLRNNNVTYYYHDETWSNSGEERRQVWLDTDGVGRLRNNDGKGTRLAISALISPKGFHLPTIDIFKCDADHNMCSDHFVQWIEKTCVILRQEHGDACRICLILDNTTWHNAQTEESKLPKRAWRKDQIEEWLQNHNIIYDKYLTKAEMLEIAYSNAPRKEYLVDRMAARFHVEIIRLPVRHCVLNPIELAWAGLKGYIRNNNTRFRLNDVHNLALEYIAAVDDELATSFFNHALQHEEIFKAADTYVEEEIESSLQNQDLDDDGDNDIDESVCSLDL